MYRFWIKLSQAERFVFNGRLHAETAGKHSVLGTFKFPCPSRDFDGKLINRNCLRRAERRT